MASPTDQTSSILRGRYKGPVGDYCCVPGCTNSTGKCKRSGKKLSFYSFPKDVKRRESWLSVIRRDTIVFTSTGVEKRTPFEPKSWSRVCSEHFSGGIKVDTPGHPDYIPSVFPRNEATKRTTQSSKKAGLTTPSPAVGSKSTRKRSLSATITSEAGRPKVSRTLDFDAVEKCEKAVWITTDHDYVLNAKGIRKADESELDHINPIDKIQQLEEENAALKLKLLRLENVKYDDAKFQFWTNLPNYSVFLALSEYLKTRAKNLSYWRGESTTVADKAAPRGPSRKLSFEEELFIVLVKLKTGNFNEDLAHRFDISSAHVSRLFTTWVNFLSNELKLLFEMQNSEENAADCYDSYQNLRIVLDCTELMVQRSSDLDSRKKTFSNYKHHDTVKFLVGLSPSLAVNYVSKAWGGRASDKHITINSDGLMDSLHPGDSVMVDRGFTISKDLEELGVQLLMPEFKGRDRMQFSANEAARSEYISRARIHIERIIQRIKTFHFLDRVIRLNMQDIVEQIFLVCAYLTNFQLPIVKRKT